MGRFQPLHRVLNYFSMILKDISFNSPEENILYDDVLLHLAEHGPAQEYLRFWESSQPFIVLGRVGKIEEDLHQKQILRDRIPVLRRSSGGGTVVQGNGCLNFVLILAKERHLAIRDLRQSYQYILGKVITVLNDLGEPCVFKPISDIALLDGEKKFSGNAQKRGRNFILHHGTILYDFDLSLIWKYLDIPKDIPEYRRQRLHEDFVTNIRVPKAKFKSRLAAVWGVKTVSEGMPPTESELLTEFLKTKRVTIDLKDKL